MACTFFFIHIRDIAVDLSLFEEGESGSIVYSWCMAKMKSESLLLIVYVTRLKAVRRGDGPTEEKS